MLQRVRRVSLISFAFIGVWSAFPTRVPGQVPYARLDYKTAAQQQLQTPTSQPQGETVQGGRRNDPDRVAMRTLTKEVSEFLKQGPVDLERARALCSYLYKDLAVPATNALWAQQMLLRLGNVANDPQTTPEARTLIHDEVRSYYEQQRFMQPTSEFVSPDCMKAMGKALERSGDDPETAALAESLQKGASDWLRRLGRDQEAKEMDEIGRDRPTDDLVTEVLRAYGQLLSEKVPLARSELVRIQRSLCTLVKRNEVKTREQWALWSRVTGSLGKRADAETRDFIRENLKDKADENKHEAFEIAWRRIN